MASITSRTVGALSTYELRQELVRRDALDLPESNINHKTMLQRLMVELVKEEKEKEATIIQEQTSQILAAKEEAKRLREDKKREAMQRSLERQANPDYFSKIAERNKATEKPLEKEPAAIAEEEGNDPTSSAPEVDDEEFDPFKPSTGDVKKKFKIFVR